MSRTRNFEAFFREADTDGSGQLDFKELSGMLRGKGYRGKDSELRVLRG